MANQSEGRETNAFQGFITPDLEEMALEDVDRMCAYGKSFTDNSEKLQKLMETLAMECLRRKMHAAACAYFARQLLLLENAGAKALCLLRMGQVMEQAGDFEKALQHYTQAFEFPQEETEIWYLLNNNRGYCLNIFGRHGEAEGFCRAAIGIQPKRYNAWKNLGVSLQGQGRMDEAALSYCEATELGPHDPRAFRLLEDLLMAHPDLVEKDQAIASRYRKCFELMNSRAGGSECLMH